VCAGVCPAQRQQPRWRAFNHVEQHDPTLLAPFGSVLGLAWHPDPTTLGPAAKLDPIAFDRECNDPAAIVDSKHSRATPPTKISTAHFLLT